MSFHTVIVLKPKVSWLNAVKLPSTRQDEREYILGESVAYRVGSLQSDELIFVPAGTITDLASVPRFLWPIIGPSGRHAGAAIIHDHLYRTQGDGRYSRRESDRIFREAMAVSGTPALRKWVMWLAVRSPGGWLAWKFNKGLERNQLFAEQNREAAGNLPV